MIIDSTAYLERMGYHGPFTPRAHTLSDEAACKATLWEHVGLVRSPSGVRADTPAP